MRGEKTTIIVFSWKGQETLDITKNKEAHSCVLVFLFGLFKACTSSTPPCEWTRCLSLCRQMEGLFPQFNEGRLLGAYSRLPWSLICSWGVHWHCSVSIEGTDPKAGRRASWQTAFQRERTIGESFQDLHAEMGRINMTGQEADRGGETVARWETTIFIIIWL